MCNVIVTVVDTPVENNTKILECTEIYTSKNFNDVVFLFGQALRKGAFLHIKKHIIIIAGVLQSQEMASVHKEILPSYQDGGSPKHSVEAKMNSFFLDDVSEYKKLLCLYRHTSSLYSTLPSEKMRCIKADTFFLDDFANGVAHHYSWGENNAQREVPGGFCLCILIATRLDKAFSGSLTLAGGETGRSKFVYKMSAGASCLVFGMYVLPYRYCLYTFTLYTPYTGLYLCLIPLHLTMHLTMISFGLPSGSKISFKVNDAYWCQRLKPILIVLYYRPSPVLLELPVEKAEVSLQQTYYPCGAASFRTPALASPLRRPVLATPCTTNESYKIVKTKRIHADKLQAESYMDPAALQGCSHGSKSCSHGSQRDIQPALITPCPGTGSITPMKKQSVVKEPMSVSNPPTDQILEILIGDPPPSKLHNSCMDSKGISKTRRIDTSMFIKHGAQPVKASVKTFLSSLLDVSKPAMVTPCPSKCIIPMKKNIVGEEHVSVAAPLTVELLGFLLKDSPLSKLLKCMDIKRKSRGSRTQSSRFSIHASDLQAEQDRALAQSFLHSVFHNSKSFIQWTLKSDPNTFDQVTFIIRAETNQGLVQELAVAHVKFYSGRGILVRWLAVTGMNISIAQYGGNQDVNGSSWRKKGLSTFLLAYAQLIGKVLFGIGTPKMFAEVQADDVKAQTFYRKKGFIQIDQPPFFIKKDLHSHYENHCLRQGCPTMEMEQDSQDSLLTLELNHWLGKVGG